MTTLHLCLLGSGMPMLGDVRIRPHSAKALALLAFLAVESDRAHNRARLAELLWGRLSDAAARQSLRQALYWLNTLGEGRLKGCLKVDHNFVRFSPAETVEVDVDRFLACVRSTELVQWRCAALLYRAPLLEDRNFEGCEACDTWLTAARARLHALAMQNLDRLVADRMVHSDLDAELEYAEALRDLDPTSEAASRHLLRILAARDEPHAVDAEWARLCNALRNELGVDPAR